MGIWTAPVSRSSVTFFERVCAHVFENGNRTMCFRSPGGTGSLHGKLPSSQSREGTSRCYELRLGLCFCGQLTGKSACTVQEVVGKRLPEFILSNIQISVHRGIHAHPCLFRHPYQHQSQHDRTLRHHRHRHIHTQCRRKHLCQYCRTLRRRSHR